MRKHRRIDELEAQVARLNDLIINRLAEQLADAVKTIKEFNKKHNS